MPHQSSSQSLLDLKICARFVPQVAQLLFTIVIVSLILQRTTFLQPNAISATTHSSIIPNHSDCHHSTNSTQRTPVSPPIPERLVQAPFYLKLHKTGSSTIAHHLFSFTRKHRLTTLRTPAQLYVSTPNPTPQKCDAIVGHHVVFNYTVIKSYMKRYPDLVITSIRLPLQRQVSWFQQQNSHLGKVSCDVRNDTLLSYFDQWYPKKIGPQYLMLQEANSREQLNNDVEKILDQFDFVFVKERLKESFECFCEKTGIRLCSKDVPLVSKNVRGGSCVEKQLLTYRSEALLKGNERDLLVYEAAGRHLACSPSEWCRCPVT